jgi:hypothetical protein
MPAYLCDTLLLKRPKIVGASTIAAWFVKGVRETGAYWTVDQIVIDADRCIGVLEFTLFAWNN